MAITSITAIKSYFEADGGRKVTLEEVKNLSKVERDELAQLAAKELGEEIAPS
ncbi:MAG: hypothetical protein PHI12_08670 [Dehalococcoidales bacterium]|nr:hypothetical protein [Dehalococcoidales bacterium]